MLQTEPHPNADRLENCKWQIVGALDMLAKRLDCPARVKPVKRSKRKARAEDFALLLAEDAEKHPEKLIPLTQERLDRIAVLMEGVELDLG